ncbi:MAG: MFS transporter [Cytophagales bacterium]|nr:MFS transporter [Cytophagales bacterium]
MITNTMGVSTARSAHRWAVGAFFFLQGICFSSWASRIPTIQQRMGLSDAGLGAVLFAIPTGLMISLPLSGWLTAKMGSRRVVILATLLYGLTLITLGLATTPLLLVVGLFLFGFTGNLNNIGINTQAVGVESLYGRSIMASFHGLWSLAGFTGAAIGTGMIALDVAPAGHFMLSFALMALGVAGGFRWLLTRDVNTDADRPIFARPDKSLMNLGLLAFCTMICEGAMFDWSGVYFKKVVLAPAAWVGAGYTAFMCTMAAGRFIADWLTARLGMKRILQGSGALTAAGLLLAVAFPTLVPATLGFLLVGFGVSSGVPLVYSAAGRSKVLSPGVALAAVSTIGFLGFLIGPPLIGLVAGATSLRVSFTIIALMGLSIVYISSRAKLA